MAKFANSVLFTPTLGGTTDWTVSAAVQGFMTPAQAGAPNGVYKYRAESGDLSQWEVGEGTYTGSGPTITRTTILQNSLGTTAKINFTAAPNVGIVSLKQDILSIEEANAWTDLQKAQGRAKLDVLKKNFITNPGMQISQENGNTGVTTTNQYPADQWMEWFNFDGTLTAQQVASLTPGGSPNRLRITIGTADASIGATQYVLLSQHIEANRMADLKLGTAAAKQVILQFGVKAPAGTYGVSIRNIPTYNRCFTGEFTVSAGEANTDVVKSLTFTLDTTGTWGTGAAAAIELNWCLAGGTTYQGTGGWAAGSYLTTTNQSNFAATSGNVFELFDVGLYEGAAAPAFQLPDFATELTACKRYYRQSYLHGVKPGTITSTARISYIAPAAGGEALPWYTYSPTMRAAPTVNCYSPDNGTGGAIRNATAGSDLGGNLVMVTAEGHAVWSVAHVAGSIFWYHYAANARYA